ncbi:uncharacterized protein LOC126678075 [Mercurialis annua]|uniref:uncharacterized protein LOC126678075 n=1 Tax=Mercurialis annua TaxID=3986 RepID=UPI00215ECB7F|nr:uncharacterized protein LOC126678075 [Mercurialis annua]
MQNFILSTKDLISMELKFLFLLFLLLALPYISRGTNDEVVDSDIYDIDYRGPETHSSAMPPPHRHGRPFVNQQNVVSSQRSSSTRYGENDNKIIHG